MWHRIVRGRLDLRFVTSFAPGTLGSFNLLVSQCKSRLRVNCLHEVEQLLFLRKVKSRSQPQVWCACHVALGYRTAETWLSPAGRSAAGLRHREAEASWEQIRGAVEASWLYELFKQVPSGKITDFWDEDVE